jgi:hypothetical protein
MRAATGDQWPWLRSALTQPTIVLPVMTLRSSFSHQLPTNLMVSAQG